MIKPLIMSILGLVVAGLFSFMGWLDSWVFFAVLVVSALLLVNQNFSLVPVGLTGMLSIGVFTKLNWMDPIIFFSLFIVSVLILSQQIVARQLDTGTGGK